MIVPDTNVLLYAYDESFPDHHAARSWWEGAMNGDEPIGLPWVVLLAFVRLATHPTVASDPRPVGTVRTIVESWLSVPHVRLLSTSRMTLQRFFELLEAAGMGGNLSTDALIAAHAVESGGRVYSNDRDFDRFPGVICINPLG